MRFSPGVPTFSPAPYHGRFSRQAVKHNFFQQQVSVRQTPNRLDCGFVQNAHRLAESFVPLEMIVKWPAEPSHSPRAAGLEQRTRRRQPNRSVRAAGLEQRTRRRQPSRPVFWGKLRARARFSGSTRPTFGKPESRFLRQGLGETRI